MTIRPSDGQAPPTDPDPLLDHLVYATPHLADTLTAFYEHTGLAPAAGGRHLGLGTRNHLVGLGPRSYLEIVGPDVDHPPDQGREMPFGIGHLDRPRLLTWAVHPPHIQQAAAASAQAGADHGPASPMQRDRPDGVRLSWLLATRMPLPLGGIAPFLIDWQDSPHPAADDLPRAELVSLRGRYPEPAAVNRVLEALNARLPTTLGPAGLIAGLATPRGAVILE